MYYILMRKNTVKFINDKKYLGNLYIFIWHAKVGYKILYIDKKKYF